MDALEWWRFQVSRAGRKWNTTGTSIRVSCIFFIVHWNNVLVLIFFLYLYYTFHVVFRSYTLKTELQSHQNELLCLWTAVYERKRHRLSVVTLEERSCAKDCVNVPLIMLLLNKLRIGISVLFSCLGACKKSRIHESCSIFVCCPFGISK